jgi:hypothetical protein
MRRGPDRARRGVGVILFDAPCRPEKDTVRVDLAIPVPAVGSTHRIHRG